LNYQTYYYFQDATIEVILNSVAYRARKRRSNLLIKTQRNGSCGTNVKRTQGCSRKNGIGGGWWNGNQLKFGGWECFLEYKCVVWGYFINYNCVVSGYKYWVAYTIVWEFLFNVNWRCTCSICFTYCSLISSILILTLLQSGLLWAPYTF